MTEPTGSMQLVSVLIEGSNVLSNNTILASDRIDLLFSAPLKTDDVANSIQLLKSNDEPVDFTIGFSDLDKVLVLQTNDLLLEGEDYQIVIANTLRGAENEGFPGITIDFSVLKEALEIINLTAGSQVLSSTQNNVNIELNPTFQLELSHNISPSFLQSKIFCVGDVQIDLDIEQLTNTTYEITTQESFTPLTKYNILFPSTLGEEDERPFDVQSYALFSKTPEDPVFPIINDDELLTLVQEKTFQYFWDFGHPNSGLARERNTSGNTVTSGGSGFGLMAMIVGVERGFITRQQAIERWQKIADFLESADRFHGAWSHWINGNTGAAIPFSAQDNGGDIVETAFLVQGLLTVRAYLTEADPTEKDLIDQITNLWEEVEWDWYTRGGQDLIYWHWSPNFGWAMNLPVRGHNETQIVYTLAAASPTYSIDKQVYDNGYARNGNMQNGATYYGITLPLGYDDRGGPLFFSHYSYLGMDPRNLSDQYGNYWEQNRSHSLVNYEHCIANPGNFVGYSDECWGLTASDNHQGYSAHSPTNDLGVITPTAAISSIPYTPEESLKALKHFYYYLGDQLWGPYGFYDAFNPTEGWWATSYLAIDQGPIVCMIENYRTGLLWDLYMSNPEVTDGLDKLGISY